MKNTTSLHSIDLIADNNKERVALEIELNDTPHIKDNILKCIDADFDKIIIAVYGSKLMKRVQTIILTDSKMEKYLREGKIKIEVLSEFLEE